MTISCQAMKVTNIRYMKQVDISREYELLIVFDEGIY